jgi:hypothetical protein
LSAYNVFFKYERARLLSEKASVECATGEAALGNVNLPQASPNDTKPKLGFASLARGVAARWKTLDSATKVWFEESARLDKLRYQTELTEWKATQVNAKSQGDDQSVLKAAPLEHLKVVTPDKKANSLGNKVSANHVHPSASSVPIHASLAPSLPFSITTASPGFAYVAQVQLPLRSSMESNFARNTHNNDSRRGSSLPFALPMRTRLFSDSMESSRASAVDSIVASCVDSRVALLEQCQRQRLARQKLSQAACHKLSWINPSNWPGTGQFYSVDEIDVSMHLQALASAAERTTADRAQATRSMKAVSKDMPLLMDPRFGMNAPR